MVFESDDILDKEDFLIDGLPNIIGELNESWINEFHAPDILPHKQNLIENALKSIKAVESRFSHGDNNDNDNIAINIYKLEIERVNYVLSQYIKRRLEKIELYCNHIIAASIIYTDKLTIDEMTFCIDYANNLKECMQESCIQHLPINMQNMDYGKIAIKPNMDHYVFIKSKQDILNESFNQNQSLLDTTGNDTSILDRPDYFNKDTQYVIKYKVIADLLEKQKILLL